MLKRNVQEMKFLFVKIWSVEIKIFKGLESLKNWAKRKLYRQHKIFFIPFSYCVFSGRIDNSSKINLMSKLSYCGSDFCF